MGIISAVRGIFSRDSRQSVQVPPAPPQPEPQPGLVQVGPYRRVSIDAIVNAMAGAGGPYDKTTATTWAQSITENWQSLTNLFRVSWLAKKIVTCRNNDMLRGGILLDWDGHDKKSKDSDAVKRALIRWKFGKLLRQSLYEKSLYGGSVIVLGIGNEDLSQPMPIKDGAVDYSGIKKGGLRYLHGFDRWRANHDGVIDSDLNSPNAGKPMYHVLSTAENIFAGQRVHWSRVIRFDGAPVPWITWRSNAMWNDSELQVVIDTLKSYDTTTKAIASLIFRANIDIIKSDHLIENLAADPEAVQARYLHTQQYLSMFRMLLLDKEAEEFESHPFQFSGLDKIWEKIMLDVAGATGIPVTRLFGQAPAGLNATGDNDTRAYYDAVAADRELDVSPQIGSLLEVIVRNTLGYLPDGFEHSFPPLWQPTAVEKSQIEKTRADRDKLYIDCGVLTPGRVAGELKEDGVYRTMEDEDVKMAGELSMAGGDDEDGGDGGPFGKGGGETGEEDEESEEGEENEKDDEEKPEVGDGGAMQPRHETGKFSAEGGRIGVTRSGKPIVAPGKVKSFSALEAHRLHPEWDFVPIIATEHVRNAGEGFSKADHYDAARAMSKAAHEQFSAGNHDRAQHLAAVSIGHRVAARRARA